MKSLKWAVVLAVGVAMGFAGGVFAAGAKKEMTVTKAEDVKWTPLDPNDKEMKGPSTSVVFGDMKKGPVGFLLHVPPDTKPGMHTHSSEYYAVTVKGTEHNFTGEDVGPGVTPGGWWYQPAKDAHNNFCEKGSDCVAFIYMPKGFDFAPVKGAAPMGEKGMEKKDMGKDKPAPK